MRQVRLSGSEVVRRVSIAPWIVGVLLVSALSSIPVAQSGSQTRAGGKPVDTAPAPWPDAKTLDERRRDAENRRLFSSVEPLAFTLVAEFGAVNRDRNPTSTKTFPATIQFARDDGTVASIPLQIRTRGHSRRRWDVCSFAPLRLELPKEQTAGTVFDRHGALKLGTHCRDVNEFEQYVLREYVVYRILNLLTPRSFRARLAKATYVDASDKKPVARRYAMFIEDDDDVAKRMEGRITDQKGVLFRRVDSETLVLMTLFAYMIGNTDMSLTGLHNIQLVQTPAGRLYPVPYDFDSSGVVNPVYAAPADSLKIGSIRERVYRGPCRTAEELGPFFDKMRAVRADVEALYDGLPDMNDGYRRNAKAYLDQFYRMIDRPRDVKRAIIDKCLRGGM